LLDLISRYRSEEDENPFLFGVQTLRPAAIHPGYIDAMSRLLEQSTITHGRLASAWASSWERDRVVERVDEGDRSSPRAISLEDVEAIILKSFEAWIWRRSSLPTRPVPPIKTICILVYFFKKSKVKNSISVHTLVYHYMRLISFVLYLEFPGLSQASRFPFFPEATSF
jgi:hypothetical protein